MGKRIINDCNTLKGNIIGFNNIGLLAFENGIESSKNVILIGGLGDTMLSLSFSKGLDELCRKNNYKFIIPQLRSQPNFRMHMVDEDIEDIYAIVNLLEGDTVLIGHSTGCQDALLYLEKHGSRNIKGIILQAPVSDIECLSPKAIRKNAKIMSNFDQSDSLYAEICGKIWLKERFESLYLRNGREDLFSSYLEDSCYTKWRNLGTRILSVVSGNDEFCTKDMTSKLELMGIVKVIDGADHGLTQESSAETFVSMVSEFLKEV